MTKEQIDLHHAVIDKMREFAKATDCPLGGNLVEWFSNQHTILAEQYYREFLEPKV